MARSTRKLRVVTPAESVKLDLACGQNVREGFKGVDLWAPDAEKVDLLKFPWPWKDDSVEELHCSHFVEHIPARDVSGYDLAEGQDVGWGREGQDMLFAFFDEAWRVLKPDGVMTVIVPSCQSTRAFQDPTHRRFIPEATFAYLSADWRKANKLDHYKVRCNFSGGVVHTCDQSLTLLHPEAQVRRFNESWNTKIDLHATLRAIK